MNVVRVMLCRVKKAKGINMGQAEPKWDRRLIGTGKSDRRRTFRNWKPTAGRAAASFPKFKAMFGKLTIRWGRGSVTVDGDQEIQTYELVARDLGSVVVRINEHYLLQIHFEDDYYWVAIGGGLCEYYRRIA